jgi:hypothetical protein
MQVLYTNKKLKFIIIQNLIVKSIQKKKPKMNFQSGVARSLPRVSHKDMYKSPARKGNFDHNQNIDSENNSPSWRSSYKKRCFDEFKKSRQKLLSKFRNLQVFFYFDSNKQKEKFLML